MQTEFDKFLSTGDDIQEISYLFIKKDCDDYYFSEIYNDDNSEQFDMSAYQAENFIINEDSPRENYSISSEIQQDQLLQYTQKQNQEKFYYSDQSPKRLIKAISYEKPQKNQQNPESKQNMKLVKDIQFDKQFILDEFDLKKELKKSINMPKSMFKFLIKHYQQYKNIFRDNREGYNLFISLLKELNKWSKESKLNSINRQDFINIFSKNQAHSKHRRLLMRKVLTKYLRKQIIPSNQIKDKREYLVTSKVFSLRCANSILSTRMQIK